MAVCFEKVGRRLVGDCKHVALLIFWIRLGIDNVLFIRL
jgi:hypothetical protein